MTISGGSRVSTQEISSDGVSALLARLEQVVLRGDVSGYHALLANSADLSSATKFAGVELAPGMTRVVIKERNREALAGTIPGNGFSIALDVFQEFGARARVSTWLLDVRQRRGADPADAWQIADQTRVSSVENLYRLSLNPAKQFTARNFDFNDEDLTLRLIEGSVFVSEIDQGTTALVLVGRGEMTFRPAPDREKTQVRIFSGGAEAIATPFDAAYIRINPRDFDRLVVSGQLAETAVERDAFRRAERVFREESPASFALEFGDLSREAWSLVPNPRDLVAEIRTRRFDTLTYSRTTAQREDISLFHRNKGKTVALYSSRENDREAARSGGETDDDELDVWHYDVDVSVMPERSLLSGRARMKVRMGAARLSNLTLRLAESLSVQSVVSEEYGRLFSLRVKDQNSLVVSLPATLTQGSELTLTVSYSGRIEPGSANDESLGAGGLGGSPQLVGVDSKLMDPEPSYLYSNQTFWYPRPATSDYATATLRITVPAYLSCVASGEREATPPMVVAAGPSSPPLKTYVFNAVQPVRYLAFVVSRLEPIRNITVDFPTNAVNEAEWPSGSQYRALNVSVEANPGHVSRGRAVAERASDIVRFYHSLVGDSPYPTLTLTLVERSVPGGHSPGYFVLHYEPLPLLRSFAPRDDPASFEQAPDYVLAHEVAHQWWGQAVGWRTYHSQWLSEGVSQYFAALYAERQSGPEGRAVFRGVMRHMRKWAIGEVAAGPISLGSRLGQLQDDSRIFRALVYGKTALVLQMLRDLVGDEAFFRGLRRFYRTSRFRSVGTDDFQTAMEMETGRPLDRFFGRWIDGSELPRLGFSYRVDGNEAVLRIEQVGDLFDLPVRVTLLYASGPPSDVLVPVTDRVAELRVPLRGPLRAAEISKDDPPLAEIVRN